ncbi:hypothetical protein [Sphaerisporangium sp. TRM90804]|uniref:SCO7613 C-terminal domain-containing membrane protein n=1 Tax=Sphaerisporangium sp. TRM90804 TaxID=3031113 RepID=UPI002448C686|nr:hypothetical protein [Sphaerisporangium sp. TRM90804]MDH2430397.1 hypothetical protein [Sphaerisporangium sp. TRM90804]
MGGPVAFELWQVDGALAGLRVEERRLLGRREELLGILRHGRARVAEDPAAEQARRPGSSGEQVRGPGSPGEQVPGPGEPVGRPGERVRGPEVPGEPVQRREVSAGAVQNLLLILGGLLLTVAAVVFTVVSWGRMGIGGRAVVLAGFTALAMLVPVVLVRRRLTATAEAVAGLAVALLLLDGYAARRVGFLGADAVEALDYTAAVFGVIALILVAYARFVPLRGPVPVAVVLAQPILPLLAEGASATWVVAALVATAALDVALVRYGRARTTSVICGSVVAVLALLGGGALALDGGSLGRALGGSASLAALALLGAFAVWSLVRSRVAEWETWASLITVGAALALIAALAAPGEWALDGPSPDWRPLAYLLPALVVVLAATWLPWRGIRLAGMATGGLVALSTALTALPRLVFTLAAPLERLETLWTGRWERGAWPAEVTSPVEVVVLGVLTAGFLALAARGAGARPMAGGPAASDVPGAGGRRVEDDPPASDVGGTGGRPVESDPPASDTGGAGGRPVRGDSPASDGGGTRGWAVRGALVGALTSGVLGVAGVPAAFAMAYPAAVALYVALACVPAVAATLSRARWWAVACALVAGPASVEAAAYAFGSEAATLIVLPILAVAAAAVAFAARVTALRAWGLGAAVLFLGLEALATGLAVGLQPTVAASVGYAVAGVLVLVGSLWAGVSDRGWGRPEWLRYTGTVLLLAATWLRLWAGEVAVVEAYTVPCSLALLGFGWWWRRSGNLSSWAAYGAGLSFTMLPSLVAVYADEEWRRSLALGVVALAVLLAGARFRLQAPTVIGGITLFGVVVREMAPYVSEFWVAVPRWVPIAVGGLLLVVIGATYEGRARDLRRLRNTLATMD